MRTIFEPFVRIEGSEGQRGVGLGWQSRSGRCGSIEARLREVGNLDIEIRLRQPVA